jgi:hypothetical protein
MHAQAPSITQSRHLYNPDGHWVAFLVGGDLFWRDGERLGWFQPFGQASGQVSGQVSGWYGGIVTSRNGGQIGVVMENGIIEFSAELSVSAGL